MGEIGGEQTWGKTMAKSAEAEEYHSKDFEWEDLKNQIEADSSLSYHFLLPFDSQHHQEHIEKDSEAWQIFHTRHSSGKFFKERRYLLKEFPELVSCGDCSKLLEVGCGNGSTVIPILRGNKNMIVYACDCSEEALLRTRRNIEISKMQSDQFHCFCCDFSTTGFPKWLSCQSYDENLIQSPESREHNEIYSNYNCSSSSSTRCVGGMDFVALIFTLSAVPQQRMPKAVEECFSVLKPGGLLLFRDYGLYDMTMLRFVPDKKLGFREYMRSDGTLSYFFCLDTVRRLFNGAGFIEVELEYCCIKSVNRRNGKNMHRVWVHGKFQKPC